jgi:ABC-2 type transport system permease protein
MVYGLLPRAASVLSWGVLCLFVVIEMAWEAQVVDWSVMRLTPFAYVHYTIPVAELPIWPLIWLVCLAAVFTGIGLLGFRGRSIG